MIHCLHCKADIPSPYDYNWRGRFCSKACQQAFDRARYLARKERIRKAYRKANPLFPQT